MIVIQLILISIIFMIVFFYFSRVRTRLWDRALLILFLLIGVTMVLFPALTTDLAHLVGVGRGADLVTYLGLLGLFFAVILSYINQRELQSKLTDLVRHIAILEAKVPPQNGGSENVQKHE